MICDMCQDLHGFFSFWIVMLVPLVTNDQDQLHFFRPRQLAQRNLCGGPLYCLPWESVFRDSKRAPSSYFINSMFFPSGRQWADRCMVLQWILSISINSSICLGLSSCEQPNMTQLFCSWQIAKRHGRWQGNEWRRCTDPQQVPPCGMSPRVLKNTGILFLGPHIDIFSFSHGKCAFELSKKCKSHLPGDSTRGPFFYCPTCS